VCGVEDEESAMLCNQQRATGLLKMIKEQEATKDVDCWKMTTMKEDKQSASEDDK
jgi:hypothetical protein